MIIELVSPVVCESHTQSLCIISKHDMFLREPLLTITTKGPCPFYPHMRTHTRTHIHAHTHTHTYAHIHNTYTYTYTCTHMHTHSHTHTFTTYTHTHTHTLCMHQQVASRRPETLDYICPSTTATSYTSDPTHSGDSSHTTGYGRGLPAELPASTCVSLRWFSRHSLQWGGGESMQLELSPGSCSMRGKQKV